MSENAKNSDEPVVDDKKADATENDKTNVSGVDNNSVNNKTEKAGNTKATTNSSKSNDDTDKNAKKSNDDDSAEAGKGTALGEIPKIEKYITNTRIDGLQTLYQICFQSVGKTNVLKKNLRSFDGFDFEVGSSDFKKRLELTQKIELAKLKAVCEGLQLDKKGAKDAICQRICEFLAAPHKIDAPTDDEEDEDDEEEEVEEEEEDEEPEKPRSKGRGNARNTVSKTGRPRRSTAGRGKADTSAYVEYSSSSDEEEATVNRGKPAKRRRDESDSGSDYNPSGSGDSDAARKGSRFSARGRPPAGSRRSARRRRSTSEEEESSPTSDDDFSDEPKKKPKTPTRSGRGAPPRRGRKAKETESEVSEEEEEDVSEPESDKSEESPKRKAPTKNNANNKSTPQRSKRAAAAAKPLKEESSGENESEDDEPLSKKAKPSPSPPTDDEIKKIVKEILDKANLEEITMKTVCRNVYSKYPDFDLSHKKEFIKTTVKSLIST
ncbi:protein DEK isoform X1 [Sitodiplosis mosellana]|uniref:protein DEK isoform X1 n=1 Tax=Sitodiplosis mosellana TaxID=263140 RepID=UPI002443D27F|nr:protein DEK isoform X1 [Sitodiplosis mosellana]